MHADSEFQVNLFAHANWVVLAPVGGITIFEHFRLDLHPLRLQVDAKVGVRIMEYLWPSRKARRQNSEVATKKAAAGNSRSASRQRSSMDSPTMLGTPAFSEQSSTKTLQVSPTLRRLGTSRSFTDLRMTSQTTTNTTTTTSTRRLNRTRSTDLLIGADTQPQKVRWKPENGVGGKQTTKHGDAKEMKTRSNQKSFVFVQIARSVVISSCLKPNMLKGISLDLVLSIQKDDSFVCRDAQIRTRLLEYRNQTWSVCLPRSCSDHVANVALKQFEELVNQFIPADMGWKGWLRMAFHQPLIPVFPVARELLTKTKFLSAPKFSRPQATQMITQPVRPTLAPPRGVEDDSTADSPSRGWRRTSRRSSIMTKTRPQTPSNDGEEPVDLKRSGSGKKKVFGFWPRSGSGSNSNKSSAAPTPWSSTTALTESPESTPDLGRPR